jgi:hypothetical protein
MYRTVLTALLLTAVAACGHPTPYQVAANGYGFSDQRIEDNRYRITFSGNSLTPQPVVENYLLYRAAEITLANGYDYFEVADKQTNKSTRYLATYDDFGRPYYWRRYPYPYPFYGSGFHTADYRPIEQFTSTANVVLFRGRKPADKADAYDARDVAQRLRPTVQLPAPATP